MNIDNVKLLIEQDKSDVEIGRLIMSAGLSSNFDNARKSVGVLRKLLENTFNPQRTISEDFTAGTAHEVFTVENPPTTLEDGLRGSQVDLNVWQVQKWIWNHWAGNYQVKIWFEKREAGKAERLKAFLDGVANEFTKVKHTPTEGQRVGVVALADFHFGMNYEGDAKNDPFNAMVLAERITKLVDKINGLGFDEIHLALLGDFIESFTGLNHLDTWKHLESYGRTALMGVCSLIRDELILRLNNVSNVYIIAGNHDRVTNKKDIDSKGEAAGLIADVLGLMVDVPINFDYAYLNPEIDGVKYILSHGHLGLSKKGEYASILEYGDQSIYNVFVQGHNHKREVKKGYRIKREFESLTTSIEGSNFRKIIVPPLVSGGAYSSSGGWFGTCGATVLSANGSGVDHLDLGD